MSDKHPYVTAPSYLTQVIAQFRKSFPNLVVADTLKKLGIAPKNESYVLNTLRYLGLIDQDGNKTELASRVFSQADDGAFSQEFGKVVAAAYQDLFELRGEDAWNLDRDALITFFRTTGGTTQGVGERQTRTFQMLVELSDRGIREAVTDVPEQTATETDPTGVSPVTAPTATVVTSPEAVREKQKHSSDIGLTVRIEINLPADGDQATYDRIFTSIRDNLLDA